MAEEILEGDLYASRDQGGWYRITKVLVLEQATVHLRTYADRFKELPAQVHSRDLSLGRLGTYFAIGHYPVDRAGFDLSGSVLVGHENILDDELDGYRIWAGIDPI